ncbi:hypothetical protein LXL04_019990 [Taraxacum kok-saghyz]
MNENNLTENNISNSMEQNIVESPIIDYDSSSMPSSKYKLKLKYGGIFRLSKKTFKKMYCFGSQKCIYIDTWSYNFNQLNAEVIKRYSSKSNPHISICYIDKYTPDQSYIELDSDEKFTDMLIMYENEKDVTIYVTTENNIGSNNLDFSTQLCDDRGEPLDEDDSDYLPSEESYYSHLSSDNEYDEMNDDVEVNSFTRNNQNMKVESKFENVTCFKRALNHYAIINEFDYFIQKSDPTRFTARCENLDCEWRIHASIMQDGVTFQVKKMVESHTCTRSNKVGNKRATQGWIANVITNKLKSDGDVPPTELRKWIMKTYNVDVPYLKVFRGKQQVHIDMYGKWEDSFLKLDEFREELLNRNQGSVVEIDFDINLGEYEVCRSCDYQAEVKCQGKRWDVYLDKRKCSCRVWQVTGRPCVHTAAFIAFIRDANWEKYVDQYFTIEKFKKAYEFQIAPLPGRDQWMQKVGEKIYPPIIKRPVGRLRKNRIKASTESKRRHKCPRCGEYGHREKTCKNPASKSLDPSETSKSKRKNNCPR